MTRPSVAPEGERVKRPQSADARASYLLAHRDEFEWQESVDAGSVILRVRSVNSEEWHVYRLTDDSCSCPATRYCYHRALLRKFGGVWHTKRFIQRERNRGVCRVCGEPCPGRGICGLCWDRQRKSDFEERGKR